MKKMMIILSVMLLIGCGMTTKVNFIPSGEEGQKRFSTFRSAGKQFTLKELRSVPVISDASKIDSDLYTIIGVVEITWGRINSTAERMPVSVIMDEFRGKCLKFDGHALINTQLNVFVGSYWCHRATVIIFKDKEKTIQLLKEQGLIK